MGQFKYPEPRQEDELGRSMHFQILALPNRDMGTLPFGSPCQERHVDLTVNPYPEVVNDWLWKKKAAKTLHSSLSLSGYF